MIESLDTDVLIVNPLPKSDVAVPVIAPDNTNERFEDSLVAVEALPVVD